MRRWWRSRTTTLRRPDGTSGGAFPYQPPSPWWGALVVRDDGCVMSGRPAYGAKASSSRAVLPASDDTAARLEQERERAITPPAHFTDA
jgi:hypothetical protein